MKAENQCTKQISEEQDNSSLSFNSSITVLGFRKEEIESGWIVPF